MITVMENWYPEVSARIARLLVFYNRYQNTHGYDTLGAVACGPTGGVPRRWAVADGIARPRANLMKRFCQHSRHQV
jgi:hypothetical protein